RDGRRKRCTPGRASDSPRRVRGQGRCRTWERGKGRGRLEDRAEEERSPAGLGKARVLGFRQGDARRKTGFFRAPHFEREVARQVERGVAADPATERGKGDSAERGGRERSDPASALSFLDE